MPKITTASQGLFQIPALIGAAEEKRVPAGSYLFKQGSEDAHFYIVMEGDLEISVHDSKGNEKVLAFIKPGELLGEGVLLGKTLKPASARAVTAVRVLALSHDSFEKLIQEHPTESIQFLRNVLGITNTRLNSTNLKLVALHEMSQTMKIHSSDLKGMCVGLMNQLVKLTEAEAGALVLRNPFNQKIRSVCSTSETLEKLWPSLNLTHAQALSNNDGHFVIANLDDIGALVLWRSPTQPSFEEENLRLAQLVAHYAAGTIEETSHRAEEKARTILHQKRYVL